jgi:hypothetical protein
MTKISNINLEFFNLKTEIYYSNYAASTDTVNKTVTIISRPIENLTSSYKTKDISLVQQQQVAQAIKQE